MLKEKSLHLNFFSYIVTLAFIFTIFFLAFHQILKYCLNCSAPLAVPLSGTATVHPFSVTV